jgi:hypothetical protein
MVRVQLARRFLVLFLFAGCVPRNAVVVIPTVEVAVRDAYGPRLEETDPDADDDGRAAGDLVEVEWRGSWWPAQLVERRRTGWFVHYENYSKDWDEVVSLSRVRGRRAPVDEPTIEPMDEDVDP